MKRESNRTPLEQVIPLSTPLVAHIETTNACNLKCRFCYMHDDELLKQLGIQRGFMDLTVFKKIICDMKSFPNKLKRIYFHLGGEPMLHPDIVEMISYAKQMDVAQELGTFSNGLLLTHELSDAVVEAGLDFIQISVEGTSAEKYEEVTGKKIDYEKFLENVAYFFKVSRGKCKVDCKIIDANLTTAEKEKFYADFQNISDECYIEFLQDFLPKELMDTSLGNGSTTTQEGDALREKQVCTNPFYVITVYYDGMVGVCSCDYKRNPIVGDVKKDSLVSIWNNEKFTHFRKAQLMGNRKKFSSCSDCKSILQQKDDIDQYAEMLCGRFEK